MESPEKYSQNNCQLNISWYHNRLAPYVEPFKKLILGGPGGMATPNYVKINWHPKLSHSKNWSLGGPRGVATPNYVKIFYCYIYADIKTDWHPKLSRSKNWLLGGPWGVAPPNYVKIFVS